MTMISAILFDLDGVLYEGDKAIAGAASAIEWFDKHHVPHLFLTNTTSKPRSALVHKLAKFGISTHPDQYLTPPLAAVQALKQANCHRLALFIPEATQNEFSTFETVADENAPLDAVVIGDLANDWNFETLNRAFRMLMKNPGAKFVALGMTRYWRTDRGLQLDAGPFVRALEYATGREAIVTGKPAVAFYHAAVARLGKADHVYMIGDDIRGDIEAALHAGLKAILVRTGKFTEADLSLGITPDTTLDSVAALPAWWRTHVA